MNNRILKEIQYLKKRFSSCSTILSFIHSLHTKLSHNYSCPWVDWFKVRPPNCACTNRPQANLQVRSKWGNKTKLLINLYIVNPLSISLRYTVLVLSTSIPFSLVMVREVIGTDWQPCFCQFCHLEATKRSLRLKSEWIMQCHTIFIVEKSAM